MTDRDWQSSVLRDLGAAKEAGAAGAAADPPAPAPVRATAAVPMQPSLPVEPPPLAAPPPPGASFAELHPSDVLPTELTAADLLRTPVAGDPRGRRAWRAFRLAIGWRAAAEVAEAEELITHIQRPVTTGRRITVLSARGGTGKSTAAALLAGTLASLRSDHVLAVDLDPETGSLPLRLGRVRRPAEGRRPGERIELHGVDDVARFLDHTTVGVYLWRRAARGAADEHTVGMLRERVRFLNRYFAVAVQDCGPGLAGAVNRSAYGDSHALVVAGASTVDGVLGVQLALRRLADHGGAELVRRCVVALTALTPQPVGVDVRRATARLAEAGVPVLALPYDRHLASGAAVETALLAATTRTAALRLAAEAMDRAVLP